jgi:hypothetical protein
VVVYVAVAVAVAVADSLEKPAVETPADQRRLADFRPFQLKGAIRVQSLLVYGHGHGKCGVGCLFLRWCRRRGSNP